MAKTILIIDDEDSIRSSLKGALEDEGFDVLTAENGESGIAKTSEELPDLVLLDIWMPGIDGIETLNRLKRLYPKLPIVIMSGHGTIEAAVKATKLGAYDFIEKPLSIEKVILAIGRALEASRLTQENLVLKGGERHLIIGNTEAIKKIMENIESVAQSPNPVLITGEKGVGKEVLAWNIHNRSPRASKPFVAVNCALFPEELMDCELFGYEKGAFIGATSRMKGRVELAHEGTLFLDEICEIPLSTQARVLRVLQENVFDRVGSTGKIQVDVRLIASTSMDIEKRVASGLFLKELFSLLEPLLFHIPTLQERAEDIPLFVEHFINVFSRESSKSSKKVMPEAMIMLKRYNWPGNVRELRNIIERLIILYPSRPIGPEHLPLYLVGPTESLTGEAFSAQDFKEAKHIFEKEFIIRKLEENGWNISKTAEAMGLERSHLHRKIKSHRIEEKL